VELVSHPILEWGVASRPHESEASGDDYLVRVTRGGASVTVVDGLGHGPAAAAASRMALDLLASWTVADIDRNVSRCHGLLQGTRGVVLAMAFVDGARGRLTWVSVGNIRGVVDGPDQGHGRRHELLIGQSGVVGRRLPHLRVRTVPMTSEDVLVLATDGIRSDFEHHIPRLNSPQHIADSIMTRYCTGLDDALVLAVRYQEGSA
jgi:phosphoserine phosphatase RsbX